MIALARNEAPVSGSPAIVAATPAASESSASVTSWPATLFQPGHSGDDHRALTVQIRERERRQRPGTAAQRGHRLDRRYYKLSQILVVADLQARQRRRVEDAQREVVIAFLTGLPREPGKPPQACRVVRPAGVGRLVKPHQPGAVRAAQPQWPRPCHQPPGRFDAAHVAGQFRGPQQAAAAQGWIGGEGHGAFGRGECRDDATMAQRAPGGEFHLPRHGLVGTRHSRGGMPGRSLGLACEYAGQCGMRRVPLRKGRLVIDGRTHEQVRKPENGTGDVDQVRRGCGRERFCGSVSHAGGCPRGQHLT